MNVGRVRKTSRKSGEVYTALRVISRQMPPREMVDKLRRDKPNLPEGSLQHYESLTDGTTNVQLLILFWILFKKTEAFDSRFKNNFQQEDSPFEEAEATHWTNRMKSRSMRTLFQY